MGNQYTALVTSVDKDALRIIIRETYRDPSMGNRPSFPAAGDAFRGYVRDTLLRYDFEEEEEDEDELDEAEHEAAKEPDLASHDHLAEDEAARDIAAEEEEEQ
jgi:hypothetical protein